MFFRIPSEGMVVPPFFYTRVIMTPEQRRKLPEHHIVHDYANLISSGKLITDKKSNAALLKLAPVNSHVCHAFYMNCRKMYEFFQYKENKKYLRAKKFVRPNISFEFMNWTNDIQEHMNVHLLHVGGRRTVGKVAWAGTHNALYLDDFEKAWETFLKNLKPKHKVIFLDEIEYKLNSEFRHCGDLGKHFLL
jgi:hypothetical protein